MESYTQSSCTYTRTPTNSLAACRPQLTSMLSITHRGTGIALTLGMSAAGIALGAQAFGAPAFDFWLQYASTYAPPLPPLLFLLIFFHSLSDLQPQTDMYCVLACSSVQTTCTQQHANIQINPPVRNVRTHTHTHTHTHSHTRTPARTQTDTHTHTHTHIHALVVLICTHTRRCTTTLQIPPLDDHGHQVCDCMAICVSQSLDTFLSDIFFILYALT